MLDLVYKEGSVSLNDEKLIKEFEKIKSSGRNASFNVVLKFDTNNGYDVSIASFDKLEDAKEYSLREFNRISNMWLTEGHMNTKELRQELIIENDFFYSRNRNYGYLRVGDDYFSIIITLNEIHTKLETDTKSEIDYEADFIIE